MYRGIVENLVLRLRDFHIGKALAKHRQLVFFAAPRGHQFATAALHGANHSINVIVAHAAHGKLDVILRCFVSLYGHSRIFHNARRSAVRQFRDPIRSPGCAGVARKRIPQFGLRRHRLHQSTLIITALACKREYRLGIAALLD